MPNYPVISFNAGELSPLIDARSDVDKYKFGCRVLENMIPLIHGPAVRRPGTMFIDEVNGVGRVAAFIYSSTIAYILLFENQRLYFYFDAGRVLTAAGDRLMVVSPYLAGDLQELQFKQKNDVMWITHPSYPPYKLSRTSANSFTLEEITFDYGPFKRRNDREMKDCVTLAPSVTTGSGTLTASAATFVAGHIGALFSVCQPRVNTSVIGEVSAAGIVGSPILVEGSFTFTTGGTWDGTVTLERSIDGSTWETYGTWTNQTVITRTEEEANIQYRINVVTLTSGTIKVTLAVNSSVQQGICRITGFTSTTVLSMTVIKDFASTDADVRWLEGSWSEYRGYPACITFYKDRAVYAGSPHQPQTVWFSATGDYEYFFQGTLADASFWLTMNSDQRNAIRWISALEALLAGTTASEWRIRSNAYDEPITPTRFSETQQTSRGSKAIQALVVNDVILFIDFVGRKVREIVLDGSRDKYIAPDLTALAEHITKTGLVAMAHQKNPDSILWSVRDDGKLLSMSYEREQDVVAWARHMGEPSPIGEGEREGTGSALPKGMLVGNNGMPYRLDTNYEIVAELGDASSFAAWSVDQDAVTGRYLVTQSALAAGAREPLKVFDEDDVDQEIHFDNTGSGDWASHDVILGATFTTDGASIIVEEKRQGALSNILWKWNSRTGALEWRVDLGVLVAASYTLVVDSKGYFYRTTAYNFTPFDDHLEQRNVSDGAVNATWHNSVAPYGIFIDETMPSTDGSVNSGKILCCGNDAHFPTRKVALSDLADVSDTITANVDGTTARAGVILNNEVFVIDETKLYKFTSALVLVDTVAISDALHIAVGPDDTLIITSHDGSNVPVVKVYDTDLAVLATYAPRNADFPAANWSDGAFAEAIYFFSGTGQTQELEDTATGRCKSVAVIPSVTEDEVWLIVGRTINGLPKSYLEQMQPRDYGDELEDAWFVDAGLKYDGVAATTLTGLDHLEGETVAVLGNGIVFTTGTVASGQITLAEAVTKAIVGLPFRYKVKPMRFDLFTRQGTSKGSIKTFAELVISFLGSSGAQYGVDSANLFDIGWPETGIYTGDKLVEHIGGFDVEDSIIVTGKDPMPCNIRAMIPRIKQTGR